MSIRKNKATNRFEVRVQYKNIRMRGGSYKTQKEAAAAEKKIERKLRELEKIGMDSCGKYEPSYEQTDENLVRRMIRRFKAHKAERLKDKQTRDKLEAM